MSLGRVACIELTDVVEMIFEAQKYSWGSHTVYHLANTYRSGMPPNAFCKVSHGLRDKVFLTHFE